MPEDAPAPGQGGEVRPRVCPLLGVSILLSGLSLLIPDRVGPLGPLAAGVLAFLGYRRVRASEGMLRSVGLARIAMTTALAIFVLHAWGMVRHAATGAAWNAIRGHLQAVEENLRTGTPEGAWDLLSPEGQARAERGPWVRELREALAVLGPLERLGEARALGGDWERTLVFEEGGEADLRLPLAFRPTFRGGAGSLHLEILVHRRGRRVTAELTELRVAPGGREAGDPPEGAPR